MEEGGKEEAHMLSSMYIKRIKMEILNSGSTESLLNNTRLHRLRKASVRNGLVPLLLVSSTSYPQDYRRQCS